MKRSLSPASPYVRKVRVLIREAGLADRVENMTINHPPLDTRPNAIAAIPGPHSPALVRPPGRPIL